MTTATSVQLDIAPLSGTIGAEIRNLDLHRPARPRDAGRGPPGPPRLQGDLLPGPAPVPRRSTRTSRPPSARSPSPTPSIPGLEDHKEVFEIDYTKARALVAVGTGSEYDDRENWHTDVTFVETPPLGSILNAIVIPEAGGDTLWADTQAAYEGLSAPIRTVRRRAHRGPRRHAAASAGCSRPSARASGTARPSPSSSRSSTPSCAPTPRPAAATSSSTRASPSGSRA